jgi:hypothetical protein
MGMSQSTSSDASQTIQPVRIVPLEAAAPWAQKPAEPDDDSIRPVAGPDGFASDAADVGGIPGFPWERRPLSRRGILAWTIGAMIGVVALATTVTAALTRNASSAEHAGALHGAEATDVANAAEPAPAPAAVRPAPAPAGPPSQAATGTHESPPVIPLDSLPLDEAEKPPTRAANTPHKAAARAIRKASDTTAFRKSARSQTMLSQRTISTR